MTDIWLVNVNMADAAAARREARRRRILENSHNRLQLISGKCADDSPRESPVRTVIPEQIQEISVAPDNTNNVIKSPNGALLSETDSFDLLSFNHDIANHENAAGDGEVPGDLAHFASSLTHEPPQTSSSLSTTTSGFWEKVSNYKYDIVLLSILIQLLYSLSLVTFEGTYFFIPVLIYIITKLIWFPSQSNSKLSSVLMLLQGVSTYRVQKIIHIAQCVGVISRDICVFLFVTICIQSLFITLKSLIT